MEPPRWHHVLNGDATRARLEPSGLSGTLAVWAETLHEGPVRGHEPRPVWRRERARFYASLGPAPPGQPEAHQLLERRDRGLAPDASVDEVVLWLEHDLFDQLCLIHHLDHYARTELGAARLSLICIGEHPSLPRFRGLAELEPGPLAALVEKREPVSAEQTRLAQRAWRAFCAPDPTDLAQLTRAESSELPFLGKALRRMLEEYPSARDGLSRTERQALEALAEGPATGAELFRRNQEAEESPFMGDLLFWAVVRRLAGGEQPLLRLEGDPPAAKQQATQSDAGARVLRGEADAVALNGIDLWRGGVHLQGREGIWRWDPAHDTLLRR